jgi:hypothetical protein
LVPVLVVAPENSCAIAVFCAALRQVPSRAPVRRKRAATTAIAHEAVVLPLAQCSFEC